MQILDPMNSWINNKFFSKYHLLCFTEERHTDWKQYLFKRIVHPKIKNLSLITQLFNRNFMNLWEYFLYTKKTKIKTLFNNLFSSVLVFDACSWEYPDKLRLVYKQRNAHTCVVVVMNTHWRLMQKRRNCWKLTSVFTFCAQRKQKLFSWLHNIMVEPLMSHGLF